MVNASAYNNRNVNEINPGYPPCISATSTHVQSCFNCVSVSLSHPFPSLSLFLAFARVQAQALTHVRQVFHHWAPPKFVILSLSMSTLFSPFTPLHPCHNCYLKQINYFGVISMHHNFVNSSVHFISEEKDTFVLKYQ
jgi:hypothetical protein